MHRGDSPCPDRIGSSNLATMSESQGCTCCELKKVTTAINSPSLTSFSSDKITSCYYFKNALLREY